MGRARSLFDLFTYWGAYTYTNVRINGDTDITGQNLWAYTADLGNGFSATLSLEDPAVRKAFTFDAMAPGFFGLNGAVVNDNGFTNNNANFGFRVPDIVANLRVDQAWGYAGVSAALHDASGAYYGTANNVGNGHPEDTYGWAIATGAKVNLPGGDIVGVNFAYGAGATGFVASSTANAQIYNSTSSVGVGWLSDGVFTTGTAVELTRAWSITAPYEHVWSPRWRTSWYGGMPISSTTAPRPGTATLNAPPRGALRPARAAHAQGPFHAKGHNHPGSNGGTGPLVLARGPAAGDRRAEYREQRGAGLETLITSVLQFARSGAVVRPAFTGTAEESAPCSALPSPKCERPSRGPRRACLGRPPSVSTDDELTLASVSDCESLGGGAVDARWSSKAIALDFTHAARASAWCSTLVHVPPSPC